MLFNKQTNQFEPAIPEATFDTKGEYPMSDETARPKLVAISVDQKDEEQVETQSTNPFANLDALRNPQDYEEFLGGVGPESNV